MKFTFIFLYLIFYFLSMWILLCLFSYSKSMQQLSQLSLSNFFKFTLNYFPQNFIFFFQFLILSGLPPFSFFFIKLNFIIFIFSYWNLYSLLIIFFFMFLNMLFYLQIFKFRQEWNKSLFYKNLNLFYTRSEKSKKIFLLNNTWLFYSSSDSVYSLVYYSVTIIGLNVTALVYFSDIFLIFFNFC